MNLVEDDVINKGLVLRHDLMVDPAVNSGAGTLVKRGILSVHYVLRNFFSQIAFLYQIEF